MKTCSQGVLEAEPSPRLPSHHPPLFVPIRSLEGDQPWISHVSRPTLPACHSPGVLATEGSIFLTTSACIGYGTLCSCVLPNITQQFQKNTYHNDKDLISEQ